MTLAVAPVLTAAELMTRAPKASGPAGWRSAEGYDPSQPRVPAGSATGGQFGPEEQAKKSSKQSSLSYNPRTRKGAGYGVKGGDPQVKVLQELANRLGLTDSKGRKLAVDGKFGPLTAQAAKALQQKLGLEPTGRITQSLLDKLAGAKTLDEAKAALAPRRRMKPGHRASEGMTRVPWGTARLLEKYNPLQKRDADGQWSDGMPDDLVSIPVKVMGGSVTASAKRDGDGMATLSANGRSVDLDDRDIRELRRMIIDAQYGDEDRAGTDGVFRVSRHHLGDDGKVHSEILVSLRPVEGKLISETGKKFSNPDDGPDDEEFYNAEFDMVVGEDNDGEFADEPNTRVSLKDLETDDNLKGFYSALERATAARRVETGNGPTDVFSPRPGVVGFRMKDDNGEPTEVTFNAGEARRLKAAIEDVMYGEGEGLEDLSIPRDDRLTFETSGGQVEARFKGSREGSEWKGVLTLLPAGAPWSVAVDGPSIDDFMAAFNQSGLMAGIRSFEAVQHVATGTRSLEAFAVMSPSPAVQLMLWARTLEAADSFLRKGKRISVERGKGGKFAKKGVGDIVDAVADVVAADKPATKARAPRSAVAKAMASGNSNALAGFDREPLRREARRRGLEVAPGTHIDVLRDMLWDDERSGDGGDVAAPAAAPGRRNELDQTLRNSTSPAELEAAAREWNELTGGERHTWLDAYGSDYARMARDNRAADATMEASRDAARISKMGSEAEISDALKGRSAKQLRAIAEEAGVGLDKNSRDADQIRADIARSLAVLGLNDDNRPRDWAETRRARKAKANKPKADLTETMDALDAIKANPRPGDDRKMAEYIATMSHKELDAVGERLNHGKLAGTREQKRKQLTDRVAHRLDMDALMRTDLDGGRGPATQEEATSYFGQLRDAHRATIQAARDAALAKRRQADEILGNLPADREGRSKAHTEVGKLTLDADRLDALPADEVNRLTAKIANAPDADTRAKLTAQRSELASAVMRGTGPGSPAARKAEIDSIIADPKPEDRDKLKAIFSKMTVAELKQVAADNNVTLLGTRKADMANHLVETTIGFRLNSDAIRYGGWGGDGGVARHPRRTQGKA